MIPILYKLLHLPTRILSSHSSSKPKSHHLSALTTLFQISLPSGLTSFLALFLLTPPCDTFTSRIEALLTLTSFLFLSAILTSLFLRLLLVDVDDGEVVAGKRRVLVGLGMGIAWLEALVGLMVLGGVVGIFAGEGERDESWGLGGLGMLALGTLGVGIVVLSVSAGVSSGRGRDEKRKDRVEEERQREERSGNRGWNDRQPKSPMPPSPPSNTNINTNINAASITKSEKLPDIHKFKATFILLILVIQFLTFISLLAIGSIEVIRAEIGRECEGIEEEGVLVVEDGFWSGDWNGGGTGMTRTVVDTSTVLASGDGTVGTITIIGVSMTEGSGSGGEDENTVTETQVLRTTTTVEVDPPASS